MPRQHLVADARGPLQTLPFAGQNMRSLDQILGELMQPTINQ